MTYCDNGMTYCDNGMTYCDNVTMTYCDNGMTYWLWRREGWWGGGDADGDNDTNWQQESDQDYDTEQLDYDTARLWHRVRQQGKGTEQDGKIMESKEDDMLWWGRALSDFFTTLLVWFVLIRWCSLEDIYIKGHVLVGTVSVFGTLAIIED